jgi:TetR/AcrR family transcriptional regulator, copper-responsive repressor
MMTSDVAILQKPRRPRGRPRSFDSAATLNKIRSCFAERGFSGTSVGDLSGATGLSTQSLYNAFGDKRAMFLQALDLEYVEVISKLLQLKEEEPSINRLRAFLEAVTARYDAAAQIPGIAFGAALADTSGDSEVGSRLRRFLSVLDRVAGEILGPDASPLVATLLSTFAIGLCLRSRSGTQPPEGLGLPALMLLLTQGSTSASSS